MTMLESGPADLPWSQNGYLLFHAIRTGNLLPRLYQWKPGITCKPLFLDTRFHQLLDISPVLVPLSGPDDPVLLPFLENAINLWGLLLFSDADLDSVTGHLRWLITVAEPVGKPTLLSLWDPPVANALFGLYPEHTGNTLFRHRRNALGHRAHGFIDAGRQRVGSHSRLVKTFAARAMGQAQR